jgi:hypothetical protein
MKSGIGGKMENVGCPISASKYYKLFPQPVDKGISNQRRNP